jgi:uncharacterized RDD family membrane protein YckC
MALYRQKDILGMDKPGIPQESLRNTNGQAPPGQDRIDLFAKYTFPSLVTRVQALVIDSLIVVSVFFLAAYLINSIGNVSGLSRGLIFISTAFLYEPCCVYFKGGTAGHYVMNVRVKSVYNPQKNIWLIASFLRFFTKGLLGWLSFLTVTSNKRKRAIHDIVSGSIMIIQKK